MARNKQRFRAIGALLALSLLAGCNGNMSKYTLFDLIAPRKTAFKAPANLPPQTDLRSEPSRRSGQHTALDRP